MARSLKIVKFNDDNLKYYIDKENLNHKEILDCIDTVCTNIINNNELLDYHVINLFGVGGKGKTLLTSKIKEELINNEFPIVYQNLYNPQSNKHNNKNNFLLNLRNKLVEKYNFSFPNFDIYITIAMNPDTINFSEYADKSYKKDNLDFFLKKSLKSISDEFTFGFTSVIFATLDKIKQNRKLLHDKNILLNLNDIASQSPESFYNELQESFIFDYNSNVKDFKKPIIIIIDSFEEFPKNNTIWLYNYNNNNSLQQIGNGLWHSLNKTVWIISGRDKLNLTIENEWSSEYVSFFELTNFSKNDTTKYLIKRNLSTEQSDIFFKNTSEGDPLLSFLLSNQLLENNNQIEILLSDTVKEKHRKDILISRYLRYIEGEDNKETNSRIKMLIALGSFTKEEIRNFPQKIWNRLFQNSNNEDIDSFLKRSFITNYSEEYFSIQKYIKELFLSETYPDYHSLHGQQLIDDYIKYDAIEYLVTKFSENKPMNKSDIIQIIRLVNTFKNIDSNEKWKKLTEEYGYFKDYLIELNEKNKKIDLINFYLIIFSEYNLFSLTKNTILNTLNKLIELYYSEYSIYYYNDISSLILSLPEYVLNDEKVASHLYKLGNIPKAKELFANLFKQDSLSFEGLVLFNHLSVEVSDYKLIDELIYKLENHKNKNKSPKNEIIVELCYFKSLIYKELFSDAGDKANYLENKIHIIQEDFFLTLDYYTLLAIYYSKIKNFSLAIQTNLSCIELIKNSIYYERIILRLADIYNNLAINYKNINFLDLHEYYTIESLKIRETYLPPNDSNVLQSQNNYALILLDYGEVNSALNILQNVLKYNLKIFKDKHIKISYNNYNIGLCYFKLEEYENALPYFKSSYDIKIEYYNYKENSETLKTYSKILSCSCHLLNTDNFQKILNKIEYILQQGIENIWYSCVSTEIDECIERLTMFLVNRYMVKIISFRKKDNQLFLEKIYTEAFKKTISILYGDKYCNLEDFKNDKLKKYRDKILDFPDYKEKIICYFDSGKMHALRYILDNFTVNEHERNYFSNKVFNLDTKLLYLKLLILSFEEYYGKMD